MKIIVVVSDFPKVTETFVLANAMHYRDQGHDARVFHLKPFRTSEVVHAFAQPIVETGFTFPWIGGASARAVFWALSRHAGRTLRCLGRILWAFRTKPKHLMASVAIFPKSLALGQLAQSEGVDHIHAEFAGYPATAAWIAGSVSDIPFSFSAHAHDIFITQALLSEKAQAAQFVRVISDFNKRFLSNLPGFPVDKLHVLRCGVRVDAATPPPAPPSTGAPMRILFVGSLVPRKGADLLLRAVAALPPDVQVSLRIVGGGSTETYLRKLATDLNLQDHTAFTGPLAADDVHAEMQAAHVLVLPSVEGTGGRSEGIPVVLMEALAQARPVITSRLSGIPELVRDGDTGILTEPGDVPAITAALTRVYKDYTAACSMGAAGQTLVAKDYDITKNAAALLAMIEKDAA